MDHEAEFISLFLAVTFTAVMVIVCLYLADRRIRSEPDAEDASAGDPNSVPPPRKIKWILVGLATALSAGAALFMRRYYGTPLWDIWKCCLLCAVLWACAYADKRSMLIPNSVLLCGVAIRVVMLCGLAIADPIEARYEFVSCAIAAAAVFVLSILCRLASKGALGFGDVKLLTLMGAFLGSARVWGALFCSMICSFVYSLALLLLKRGTMKTEIPFAPLLLVGTLLSLFLTSV